MITLANDYLEMDDFGCVIESIKVDEDGTFEIVAKSCVAEGGIKSAPSIYGYERDGDVVALSFHGPIIPAYRCSG